MSGELDEGDLDTPGDRADVEDLPDVKVDVVGLRQGLVKGVPFDHFAQRGLRDLVDPRAPVRPPTLRRR